jgi:hypothetical protein
MIETFSSKEYVPRGGCLKNFTTVPVRYDPFTTIVESVESGLKYEWR